MAVILVMDSYLLRSACILSLNSYLIDNKIDDYDIFYVSLSNVVLFILAWFLQKETKLFFY
jgi:hypothetical protein